MTYYFHGTGKPGTYICKKKSCFAIKSAVAAGSRGGKREPTRFADAMRRAENDKCLCRAHVQWQVMKGTLLLNGTFKQTEMNAGKRDFVRISAPLQLIEPREKYVVCTAWLPHECNSSTVSTTESTSALSADKIGRSMTADHLASAMRNEYRLAESSWDAKEIRRRVSFKHEPNHTFRHRHTHNLTTCIAKVLRMDPGARHSVHRVKQLLEGPALDTKSEMEIIQAVAVALRRAGWGIVLHVTDAVL